MIKRVNISLSEAGRRVFAAAPRLVGITLMVMRLFGKFFAVIFGLCGAVINTFGNELRLWIILLCNREHFGVEM